MTAPARMTYRSARLRTAASLITLVAALAIAGCNSVGDLGKGRDSAHAINPNDSPAQIEAAAEYWIKRFADDPKDKTAAINVSVAMRAIDKKLSAVLVMRQAQEFHPDDPQVLGELGKALADAGQMQEAAAVLEQAQKAGTADWRMISAYGAVLDQMQRHADAQKTYAKALELAPNEPSIMSNLGLSYALDKKLPEAETILRKAAAHPSAPRQAKENLALVLGLQGKFAEAEAVAKSTLPPEAIASNTSYLKQMLAQPANWAKLEAMEAKNTTGSTN